MASESVAPDIRPKKVTAPELPKMKRSGRRITMLTAYDATFARLFDRAGADVLLVGDSLGMVVQGQPNTLGVTMEQMIYHTRAVVAGADRAHVVADMPFMSYQASLREGLENAGRLVKEGLAEAVKIEGGRRNLELVERTREIGIPVMGHVGLTPQSVNAMGGFKVQGRQKTAAKELIEDALALEEAGIYAIVLEGMPEAVAEEITSKLSIPTIGIGAGVHCDGQVLVGYDALGMNLSFSPKFVKRYETLETKILQAASRYVQEVQSGAFPSSEHSFSGNGGGSAGEARAASADASGTIPLYPSGKHPRS